MHHLFSTQICINHVLLIKFNYKTLISLSPAKTIAFFKLAGLSWEMSTEKSNFLLLKSAKSCGLVIPTRKSKRLVCIWSITSLFLRGSWRMKSLHSSIPCSIEFKSTQAEPKQRKDC